MAIKRTAKRRSGAPHKEARVVGIAGAQPLLRAIVHIYWTTDEAGRLDCSMGNWQAVTGLTEMEAQDFGWLARIHPEDRRQIHDHWQSPSTHRAEKSSYRWRIRIWSVDHDDYHWHYVHGHHICTLSATAWAFCAIDIDRELSAHLQLEARSQELEAVNAQLDALLDNAPFAVFLKDPQLRFVRYNAAYVREFGRAFIGTPDSLLGKHQRDFCPPEVVEIVQARDELVIETGRAHGFEDSFDLPEGPKHVHVNLYPVASKQGEQLGIGGFIHDITARVESERALKDTLIRLERSNAELERFAHVASHDLQEPLRMVERNLRILEEELDALPTEDARTAMAFALRGATRMKGLLRDLLELSKVSANARPITTANLSDMIEDVLAITESRALECEATIETGELPETFPCDAAQIGQVLINLVTNALKYRHPKRKPHVRMTAEIEHSGALCICVADNGSGIAEEHRARIFKVFERVHAKDKIDGSGLGLAICEKIVQRHGGSIWVEPAQPGPGSAFFIRLPQPSIEHSGQAA